MCVWKLTVDADDFDHGEGEEGQRRHLHLDQDGRQQEDHQDDHQAAGDPELLRNPERREQEALSFCSSGSPQRPEGHL